ncbi:MAG: SAM-dependent methyltransferase [Chloroflexota bacterium]
MSPESIIDDSKPNAGRMYDYMLGGFHNFAIDRQAAKKVLEYLPFMNKTMRLQRWALQDIAEELERRGYDVIIDFASGLPTNDHIHHKVSKDVTVIYSDYDPVVVEYGLDILKDASPNVYFFQSDAVTPDVLLNHPQLQEILAGRRKLAFVYWGVSLFLPDDGLKHAAQVLYEWAAPESCLVFNVQAADVNLQDPASQAVLRVYEQTGSKLYFRSLKEYQDILKPWPVDDRTFISLLQWHGFEQSLLSQEDISAFGPMGGGFGAYLVKP